MKPRLIVNPASGNGRTGRHFDHIARLVHAAIGDFDCSFTRRRGDGVVLAREAARAGVNLVVAVGGDGTASEVIDGLVDEQRAIRSDITFGFIPRGTGGDLGRTLGCPSDSAEAARVLSGQVQRTIDLGRIEFIGHDGRPQVRHFVNVAGAGIAGLVVQHVEGMGKALGGKASFMIAAGRALVGWRDQGVRWRVDAGPWQEEAITAISVCNGRYFGGGMMVAPDARMDDGLFDVTIWRGLGLSDFILRRGMLYDGTHVRLANTRVLRGSVVEAEPVGPSPILLDVDGEQPGRLPARFTILPGALRACVAERAAGSGADA